MRHIHMHIMLIPGIGKAVNIIAHAHAQARRAESVPRNFVQICGFRETSFRSADSAPREVFYSTCCLSHMAGGMAPEPPPFA